MIAELHDSIARTVLFNLFPNRRKIEVKRLSALPATALRFLPHRILAFGYEERGVNDGAAAVHVCADQNYDALISPALPFLFSCRDSP